MYNAIFQLLFISLGLLVLYNLTVYIVAKCKGISKAEAEKSIQHFLNGTEPYKLANDTQLENEIYTCLKSVLEPEHFNSIKRLSMTEYVLGIQTISGVHCLFVNVINYEAHKDNVDRLMKKIQSLVVKYLSTHNLSSLTFSQIQEYNSNSYICVYFAENEAELQILKRMHSFENAKVKESYKKIEDYKNCK